MKITSLRIKNLYSFEDENIVFNDFNLIVGPNGGGKINIIRSLKTIINRPYSVRNEETENNKTTSYSTLPIGPQAKLENLLYSSISPDIKLSRENKSAIKLECQISKEELRLLFEFIFKKDIEIEEIKDYDDAVFTLLITWPVEFSSNINPDFLIFRFPNGFTFLHSNSYNNYFTYIDEQNVLDDFLKNSISSDKIFETIVKEKFCNENNFASSIEDLKMQKGKQLLILNVVYNNKELIRPIGTDKTTPAMTSIITPLEYGKPINGEIYPEYRKKIVELLPEDENFLSSMLNNKDDIKKVLAVSYYKQKDNPGYQTKLILNDPSKPELKHYSNPPLTSYESYQNDEPIGVKSLLLYSEKLSDFRFPQRYGKKYFSDIKDLFFDKGVGIDLSNWIPDIWLFLSNLIFQKIILFNEVPLDENSLTEKLFNLKTGEGLENNYSDMKSEFKKVFGDRLDFDVVTSGDKKAVKVIDNNRSFELKDSASGYFDVLSLFTEISAKKDSVIILDEPLTRLHHSKQRLVGNGLFRNQNQNQIIMVTHSPSFVNYEVIKNNNLIYVRRNGDGSRIYKRNSNDEIPKSHLLNPDVFFSNFVLAVEGATDEAVFKAISDCENDLCWQNDILILNMQGKDNAYKFGNLMYQYGVNFIILVDHDYDEKGYVKKNDVKKGEFHLFPFEVNTSDYAKLIYVITDGDEKMDHILKNLGCETEKDSIKYYDFTYDIIKNNNDKIKETPLFFIINKIKELLKI